MVRSYMFKKYGHVFYKGLDAMMDWQAAHQLQRDLDCSATKWRGRNVWNKGRPWAIYSPFRKTLSFIVKEFEFHVVVFYVVTPCSDVVRYQTFGGLCCPHLQGVVNGARTDTDCTAADSLSRSVCVWCDVLTRIVTRSQLLCIRTGTRSSK